MEDKIKKRIAELEKAEREATIRLTVIANLLTELRGLLQAEAPVLSGDPLRDDV